MKKFFDRFLFSRFGAQLLASIVIVLVFSALALFCRRMVVGTGFLGTFQFLGWGLKQVSSPAGAVGTIVIATPGPDEAVRAYAELANSLRRLDVAVLVWQATDKCPRKPFLQTGGDCAKLRFFGMTDRFPWKNPARQTNGSAVSYFYDLIFQAEGLPKIALPEVPDDGLLAAAKRVWNLKLAMERWFGCKRWAKWSSINAGDSLKEKAFSFADCAVNVETRRRLLHAEHNRWWTERLLFGWKPCAKPMDVNEEAALRTSYRHWDMIPFDQLDDSTRALDRVCIAAMAACGYIDC